MNDYRNTYTRLQPTLHSIEQFRLRFYPDISDKQAERVLRTLAKRAKPLKTQCRPTEPKRGDA